MTKGNSTKGLNQERKGIKFIFLPFFTYIVFFILESTWADNGKKTRILIKRSTNKRAGRYYLISIEQYVHYIEGEDVSLKSINYITIWISS